MSILDSALFPNLLYLALVAGIWLAALAAITPGTGLLELLALVSLAAAGLGTTVLPLNPWALVVLAVGVVCFILALRMPRPQWWLAASAVALSLGSVFLFRLENGRMAVHPLLASGVSLLTLGYFWLAVRSTLMTLRSRPSIDPDRVIGETAEVRTRLDPTGSVYVLGELWTARCDTPCEPGGAVRIVGREGLLLLVEPVETEGSDT